MIASVTSDDDVAALGTIRENKLSLVERLADDLAHEIKNPLHSMVINLEVLRRRLARLDPAANDELMRYTGVLGSELERVNRRVDLLLRIVRPNPISEDVATLGEVMEDLEELIQLECERRRVQLLVDLPLAAGRARFPRAESRQMILTLALKTLDSLPRGSTLRLGGSADPPLIHLHFEGIDSSGDAAGIESSSRDIANLLVVRTLAERLGGRLDAVPAVSTRGNGGREPSFQYLLSLPIAG